VMNKQRETIYGLRKQLIAQFEQREYIIGDNGVAKDLLGDITAQFLPPKMDWDIETFAAQVENLYAIDPAVDADVNYKTMNQAQIEEAIWAKARAEYEAKEQLLGDEAIRGYERYIVLNIIDQQWKDHLLSIDHLKQGIGLVGYGQKDPLVEYKKQSFNMFQGMLDRIDQNMVRALFNLEIVVKDEEEELRQIQQMEQQRARKQAAGMAFAGAFEGAATAGEEARKSVPFVRDSPKLKPNDMCHCGSGKKFKKCHGASF
jgi:preprotein translocase subunit SecA